LDGIFELITGAVEPDIKSLDIARLSHPIVIAVVYLLPNWAFSAKSVIDEQILYIFWLVLNVREMIVLVAVLATFISQSLVSRNNCYYTSVITSLFAASQLLRLLSWGIFEYANMLGLMSMVLYCCTILCGLYVLVRTPRVNCVFGHLFLGLWLVCSIARYIPLAIYGSQSVCNIDSGFIAGYAYIDTAFLLLYGT
jgi:predicted neutral ceramidase superfamily lipid hydrolase